MNNRLKYILNLNDLAELDVIGQNYHTALGLVESCQFEQSKFYIDEVMSALESKSTKDENKNRQVSSILYLHGLIYFKNGDYNAAEKSWQLSLDLYQQEQNEAALLYLYCFRYNRNKEKSIYAQKINDFLANPNISKQNKLLTQLFFKFAKQLKVSREEIDEAFREMKWDEVHYENPILALIAAQALSIFFENENDEEIAKKCFSFLELHLQHAFFSEREKHYILKAIIFSFTFDGKNQYADLKSKTMQYIGDKAIKIKRNKEDPDSISILAAGDEVYALQHRKDKKYFGSGTTARVVKCGYLFYEGAIKRNIIVKISKKFDDVKKESVIDELRQEAFKLRKYCDDSYAHVAYRNNKAYLFKTNEQGRELLAIITHQQLYKLFTLQNRLEIIKGVLVHLLDIWKKNVIHLDIKPDNVIVKFTLQGEVITICKAKLIDFGHAAEKDTKLYKLRGTPEYISTEMLSELQKNGNFCADFRFDTHSMLALIAIVLIPNDAIVFEQKDAVDTTEDKITTPFNFYNELGGTEKTNAYWQACINEQLITIDELLAIVKMMKTLQTVDSVNKLEAAIEDVDHLIAMNVQNKQEAEQNKDIARLL